MSQSVLVTGGCGYVGVEVVKECLKTGRKVSVVDSLLHKQERIAEEMERAGVEVFRGDIRDSEVRDKALRGIDAVVHLAAIVGDPACARDPELSQATNVIAASNLVNDATERNVRRLIFASTCSNYGRMSDSTTPIAEDGVLAPVSLYAEQKVAVERSILQDSTRSLPITTCLRFATVYGVAPRMRFDLTVNEFARDLWADRSLEVFGEQFWRPYVHVRDVAKAVRLVLNSEEDKVANEVFNVGSSTENYRKLDLIKIMKNQLSTGSVTYISKSEDPRDYRVSFDKIKEQLGYTPDMTVEKGVAELVDALDAGRFDDPYARSWRNID